MEHHAGLLGAASRPHENLWEARDVLITGATGFIGRHLLQRLLRAGANVYATTRTRPPTHRSSVHWIPLDLTNSDALCTAVEVIRPELVIHLGGRVSGAVDPALVEPTFRTLLTSSIALLSATQAGNIGRLVLVGSADEARPGEAPGSPYGAAKAAMTSYAKMYAEAFSAPVVYVRPTDTFGPGQASQKLLPYAAAAVLRGERPRLASGARKADWIYVDDVVDGLLTAASHAPDGAELDLGTGVLRTNRAMVEGLLHELESDIKPLWGALPDRPGEPERAANLAETMQVLTWRPQVSLGEGLRRTAQEAIRDARRGTRLDDVG